MFEPQNSPFVPASQREISRDDRQRTQQPIGQQPSYQQQYQKQAPSSQYGKPLVDLQVYQPPPPKKPQPKTDIINPYYYAPFPAQSPYFPPQMNPMWPYYMTQPLNPIVKQYSINNGPFVNYSTINVIKEDILPKQFVNTSNTLGERLNIHNFIRSVFIKYHDGEDIDLDGKGNNSLLSYLKFIELNPYNMSNLEDYDGSGLISTAVYRGLPDDMVIYRSCYPIRYDERTNTTKCAPNSIGMNIKIYKLTNAEYAIKKLQNQDFYEFNVWRELAYYEYIREEIIKRKMCPNFTCLYAYYISERCNLDFDKIKQLKGTKYRNPPQNQVAPPIIDNMNTNTNNTHNIVKKILSRTIEDIAEVNSGKGIVALTEGHTYNLFGWSSKIYKRNGNVHTMVNTGYHKKEVWISILFQIMVAMYVLQINNIVFNGFSLEDNVYIKDISQHDNLTTYWKYIINGFEFYIPNYGYLAMIDSNYKDPTQSGHTLLINNNSHSKYKIFSSMFNDGLYSNNELHNMAFNVFKNTINNNIFTNVFTNNGGTPPPDEIFNLLDIIQKETNKRDAPTNIDYYITLFMGNLLNNRIGTYLTELEIKNIRMDDNTPFKNGQIVAHQTQHGTYKFAVIFNENHSNFEILTKNDPKDVNLTKTSVEKSLLFNYSKHEPIMQNYKPMEAILNEDELLETYIINAVQD